MQGKRVGTHEHLLQQQQQQQQHGAGWEGVLKSTLLRTSQCTQHATSIGRLARSLHRVNHGTCGAARATIRHLSLTRYQRGRQKAKQLAAAVGGTATSAMAAAAVAPPLPWDLLAATPSLTSLDMRGDQLEALMEGGGDAATAAAAAASSAAPAAAPASLAAILGRLRCLRVDDVCGTSQLTHLGQLLAGTTQLTQLVIKVGQGHQHVGCSPLLEAPQGAQQGSAAAAAAAAGPGGGSSAWLPALCHLEVLGDAQGLLPALLGEQQAASQLTRLHLKSSDSVVEEVLSVGACSALRELELSQADLDSPPPADLTRLTALTRLVLYGETDYVSSPVVWQLTSLRRLELRITEDPVVLSSSMSNLCHLRALCIDSCSNQELPEDFATWLPQLEELDVAYSRVRALPPGLTRLTRLRATKSKIRDISHISGLVALKELDGVELSCWGATHQWLQPLSRLSALETLFMSLEGGPWRKEEGQGSRNALPPLPSLRSLRLCGYTRVADLQAVVSSAQQLTRLSFTLDAAGEEVEKLSQLGVLPRLELLELYRAQYGPDMYTPLTAAAWLAQQLRLTDLTVTGCIVSGAALQQLPPQLERLNLGSCFLSPDQPAELTHLSCLRWVSMNCQVTAGPPHGVPIHVEGGHDPEPPPWLSSLRSLEGMSVWGLEEAACRKLLLQLPGLRHVSFGMQKGLLRHAPHLCW